MAVELIVEDINKVDASIRGAYVERDGKFYLDADVYSDMQAQGLKQKNRELLGKVRQTKTSEERVAELETELRHYKLVTPMREMALKAGILPDRVELALLALEKRFVLGEDGEIVTLDERGNATEITPQKFLNEIYVHQAPFLYAASKAAGSGAHPNTRASGGQSNTMTRTAFEALSPEEKVAFSKRGGTLTE